MRAVIYARISVDDGRGLGVNRQEQDCRRLCEARGWTVAEVIVDNDVSAYRARRRPGYEALMDGLRSRSWDALIVWHPDRLHRRPIELEEFITVVEASGVQVSTVTAGEYDLATPDGRLLARITGSVARKESEDKSRRLRRKHLELAESGAPKGGGRRPFGFEPDQATIREEEAQEIRLAVERVLAGASLRSIVLDWRERVPTTSGGAWEPRGVKRILSSPRIAGLREHQGQVVGAAQWPAIVDPDDAVRVRTILAANNGPAPVRSYLLAGWLRCECGALMSGHAHHLKGRPVVRRYICQKDRGCGRCGISAPPLDDLVGREVVEHLSRKVLPVHQVPVVSPDVEARLEELAEMWAAGEVSRIEWGAARRALEARRDAVAVVPVPSFAGRDIAAEWEAGDLHARRDLVAAAVERVIVARAKAGANRFDSDRLKVEWR